MFNHQSFDIDLRFEGKYGEFCYQTLSSVGADIPSQEEFELAPNEIRLVKTGLFLRNYKNNTNQYFLLPEFQIRPRSGLSKKGIFANQGTIDPDYLNQEILVNLENRSGKSFLVQKGDRIAQLVCALVFTPTGINIKLAVRQGGHGSTGV